MTVKRNSSYHLSHQRLRELASPSLAEKGYVALPSILTPEESAHFRECADCIDALGNIVREVIADREKKKSATKESG